MSERMRLGGTDGFRGPFGEGLITPEVFAGATNALVARQQELGHTGPVVVVQDTRRSGRELREAVIAGALARGANVWDLGVAPTPVAQWAAKKYDASVTISVSASHNLELDNGWKGMAGSSKPSKVVVDDITDRYWQLVDSGVAMPTTGIDGAKNKRRLLLEYEAAVVEDIQTEFNALSPLQDKLIVVDGAYGAGQRVTPGVLKKLGAEVVEYCCDRRGAINDGCGATNLEGVKNFLQARPYIGRDPRFIGIVANDGDADRVMAGGVVSNGDATQRFVEIDGNHFMDALAENEPGIVGTEYTNMALIRRLQRQKIGFESCPNGDVNVTQALLKRQANGEAWRRGGEFSGHLVDTDWLSSGDGVRMAAWFACYAATRDMDFAQVYKELPLWPEKSKTVVIHDRHLRENIKQNDAVDEVLAAAREKVGKNGKIIVRGSGTEPLVRILCQAEDSDLIDPIVDDIENAVLSAAA